VCFLVSFVSFYILFFFPTIILRMQVMDMFVQCYPIHMENVYACVYLLSM
jgi:hypothetical protein